MKVKSVALIVTLASICGVFCAPKFDGVIDNETITSAQVGSSHMSVFLKRNSSEEDIRAFQSKTMRSYMNVSVDPCDDFYEYACGNWAQVHPILREVSESSVLEFLNNKIQSELREILLEPVIQNAELNAEDKARVYFTTCMDEEAIKQLGVKPLLNFINELGGWPVLDDNWSKEGFNWLQLAIKTALLGYPSILYPDVGVDLKNLSRYTIYLDEARLGVDEQVNFWNSDNFEHLDAFGNLIVSVLKLLNVESKKAIATAKEIVDFGIQLANISPNSPMSSDNSELWVPTTIEDLSKNISNIDWHAYLSAIVETPLRLNQSIIIVSKQYFGELSRILRETETKTLANFMVWQSIHPFLDDLDEHFRIVLHNFQEALSGQKESLDRWKECLKEMNSEMRMVTGAMLMRRYFDEDSRNMTIDLLVEIKEAFRETFLELDWIDGKTKELAQKKLNQTGREVTSRDYNLSPAELDSLYRDLNVVPGKRFENSLNLERYSTRLHWKRIRESTDKALWSTTSAVVNSFFQLSMNRIGITGGVLQPPRFHKHFPRALNSAAMGVFMSHELTHGLDGFGSELDVTGNMKWWSPEAIKEFKEREECFVEQYRNFSKDGMHLREENLADNGGIRQAYQVYRKRTNSNRGDELDAMPGMDLTNNQLFFLGFAQMFCNTVEPVSLGYSVQGNSYNPSKFRVMRALANYEEFSESFNCPSGRFMNPETKCHLW